MALCSRLCSQTKWLSFSNIGQVCYGWGLGLKRFYSYEYPTWFNKRAFDNTVKGFTPNPLNKNAFNDSTLSGTTHPMCRVSKFNIKWPMITFSKKYLTGRAMYIIWVSNVLYEPWKNGILRIANIDFIWMMQVLLGLFELAWLRSWQSHWKSTGKFGSGSHCMLNRQHCMHN